MSLPAALLPPSWFSEENHIALNPTRSEEAFELAPWADQIGLRGLAFFQTSGSESLPKWVGLPKHAFEISAQAVNAHFEVTSEDHWLIALPLHHVGGFSILIRAHLSGSQVTHTSSKWQPQAFADLCEQAAITLVSLVPTQVHDLVTHQIPCPPRLRAAIIGGGGMTQALADAARALGWPVFQSYGMTESASQIATQTYHPGQRGLDVAVLEVLPHWQLRTDATQRLLLSGPALAKGYALRDATGHWTWQPIPSTGLLTRDRVSLWDHGTQRCLSFLGRESGYVKILGELVHLAPLQAQLETLSLRLNCRKRATLIPLADPRRGCSLVLLAEDAAEAERLKAAHNDASPPLLHVEQILLLDPIPTTDLGKGNISALIQWLGQQGLKLEQ